ncbi:hypothetical protein A3A76_01780 [Candidatus Woesebacteria bacterium RIFCSPLOWO2_01_FULL_39_23]|uniref:Uncharacterized protein n=1 Tax=Candidatus Woesebacteria bacterium RIFCSPHIGHO2_01_FULL_40_22 TaxID=1802499 RepID=A0A1F7YF73_9BACT|nr:MAG: hypothetical protein A2141_02355 [Candidatus Woesebacteria bacterium RBG_16_40_11]OGM25810.1 MAG: hypothetical protein A2628_00635 [Candidatus Woesebacteria bacterium RIFCSPHIGHO2_01_FULL_40_22]OGM61763.1 MAG: hypothetical protein A3A76_01780 [Candidatus Woesebacteria bacterium RIFCSPLOWO2_01_FULL_39_23]
MKKVLLSILSIGVVAVVAVYATSAFFSDEETSRGNTFQAGAIDLKVDYDGYYNKAVDGHPDVHWDLKDLETEKFFNLADVKPGDFGEGTISLHVYNNPAWACVTINPTLNDDNGSTEPELIVDEPDGDSIFDGELAQNMQFKIWADLNCNNVKDDNEPPLTEGSGPITPRSWAIADSQTGRVPLNPDVTYCLGVEWKLPKEVGNVAQTDKYMADISFYTVQSRNNEGFVCPVQEGFPTNTLRLENESEVVGRPWEVIEDGMYVDMTYNSSGSTFDYNLDEHGLPANTTYDLIYYADGWPGNNPGALIGKHATDGLGNLITSVGNVNLGMDLPHVNDGNYAIGAKIWMIPDAAYDDATKSVVVWPPDFSTWLFEGNVYIHYDDTDI